MTGNRNCGQHLATKQADTHGQSPIAEVKLKNMAEAYVTSNKVWLNLCGKVKYMDSQYKLADIRIVARNQMAKTIYVITAKIS